MNETNERRITLSFLLVTSLIASQLLHYLSICALYVYKVIHVYLHLAPLLRRK